MSQQLVIKKEFILRVFYFSLGFSPITFLALSIFEFVPLYFSLRFIILPALVVGILIGLFNRNVGRLALFGFISGLIAVFIYDLSRIPFVLLDLWPDFIPNIGGWVMNQEEPDWVRGYLWRYIGNGGGLGVAFFMGFHFIEPWVPRRQAGMLFGIAVFIGLLGTLLLAPRAQEKLFVTTYVAFFGGLLGHLVYGYVLGWIADKWAFLDKLDELFDISQFHSALELEIQRSARGKEAFSLAFFSIDNLEPYDDPYGHPARNKALRKLANIIKLQIRNLDTPSRYTESKFMVLFPQTSKKGTTIVAERIRAMVAATPFSDTEVPGEFTISGGITTSALKNTTAEQMLKDAEKALATANTGSKNKIVYYSKSSK